MKEYIEQETAVSELNRIEKLYRDTYMSKVRAEMTHYCCEVIKHIPAADVVEVRRAAWQSWEQDKPPFKWYSCDYCGFHALSRSNFCPNCGADMRPTSMSGANEEERSYEA